ncbi:MAG: hypothetical protein ABI345_06670 [Jatrophihabitans sp.]
MLTGVVFCPQAPVLVSGVGLGDDPDLDAVRSACRTAIRRVATPGTRVAILGSGDRPGLFAPSSRGSFAALGADVTVCLGPDQEGPLDLPLSLTVGAWLVRDALGAQSSATGAAVSATAPTWPDLDADVVVVVGDGSARRTTGGPGYLDDRAQGFDGRQADALRSGEPSRLAPDAELGAQLLAAGVPAWTAAAGLPGRYDAELLYDAAPFGVGYFVATWTRRETPDA